MFHTTSRTTFITTSNTTSRTTSSTTSNTVSIKTSKTTSNTTSYAASISRPASRPASQPPPCPGRPSLPPPWYCGPWPAPCSEGVETVSIPYIYYYHDSRSSSMLRGQLQGKGKYDFYQIKLRACVIPHFHVILTGKSFYGRPIMFVIQGDLQGKF